MPGDLESSGESSVYPISNLELRWSFIRKVYSITIFQLLLIIAVVSIVHFVHPVANFFNSTQGTVVYVVLILILLIALFVPPMSYYQQGPLRYFLLCIIMSSALPVGLTCVFAGGTISLEIIILVTIMMFILTLYTFWAAKEGHDLSLLVPFLFGSFSILIFLSIIQIVFLPSGIPLEKLLSHNFGCVVSIIFCVHIVTLTEYLIKTFTYDQHILAFVVIYLVVIIIFFIPLLILRRPFTSYLSVIIS